MTKRYVRPAVESVEASRIVDQLGPASCGSQRSQGLSFSPIGSGSGSGQKSTPGT